MNRALCYWAFSIFSKIVLPLRYKIRLKKSLKNVKKNKKRGLLIAPNHPAEIDPFIINSVLGFQLQPRPVIVEYVFKWAPRFFKKAKAITVPNFETSINSYKRAKMQRTLDTIKEALHNGENVILYPSGRLKPEGHESLNGASLISSLLKLDPSISVLLMRSDGLWGSKFSRAWTGGTPNFFEVFSFGIKAILKNWIFFTPKRHVEIDWKFLPKDVAKTQDKKEINQYIEKYYNQYHDYTKGEKVEKEPLRLIPYSVYDQKPPQLIVSKKEKTYDDRQYSSEFIDTVLEKVSELTNLPKDKISLNSNLTRELDLDSLDIGELFSFVSSLHKKKIEINMADIETLKDLLYLSTKDEGAQHEYPPNAWKNVNRESFSNINQETLIETFFDISERLQNEECCQDKRTPVLTYKRFRIAVLLLAEKIRHLEGKYIGILLPASVGGSIATIATIVAGKIPAMLNWTTGSRNLDYANKLLHLKTILSSDLFLEKMNHIDLGEISDRILPLEQMKAGISFFDKLRGVFRSMKSTSRIKKIFKVDQVKKEDTALVIFTSGSENYPKPVALSHHNILTNQRDCLAMLGAHEETIFLASLPWFHSFGCVTAGLFPILFGFRVYYSPDPTDYHTLAEDIEFAKPTMYLSPPSFLIQLLDAASEIQLRSISIFITGAEKAPESLKNRIEQLPHEPIFLEGYGITECSPVVTVTSPSVEKELRRGVGQALPSVFLLIVNPETNEILNTGEPGEVYISGPSVFKGYLGTDHRSPFVDIEGRRWYRSGDIGYLDEDRILHITGRRKRFTKIGGEMISLSAIEGEIVRHAKKHSLIDKEQLEPSFYVGVREGVKNSLILCSTVDISLEKINQALIESGFSNLCRISEIKKVSHIHILGSGKLDIRKMNTLCAN